MASETVHLRRDLNTYNCVFGSFNEASKAFVLKRAARGSGCRQTRILWTTANYVGLFAISFLAAETFSWKPKVLCALLAVPQLCDVVPGAITFARQDRVLQFDPRELVGAFGTEFTLLRGHAL